MLLYSAGILSDRNCWHIVRYKNKKICTLSGGSKRLIGDEQASHCTVAHAAWIRNRMTGVPPL